MWRRFALPLLMLSGLIAIVCGCGQEKKPQLLADIGVAEYTDSTLEFPQMHYVNGQTTINDRCPVRKVKLNRRLTPLFVNGKPIGFC